MARGSKHSSMSPRPMRCFRFGTPPPWIERGRDRYPFGLEFTGGDGSSLTSSSQSGRPGVPKVGGAPLFPGAPYSLLYPDFSCGKSPPPPPLTAGRAWEQVVYSWDWNIQFELSHRGGTTSTVAVCTRPRRLGTGELTLR
jgi:hypothetical protein